MKRVFGTVEAVFDLLYLFSALLLAALLLFHSQGNPARMLAGLMALLLAGGDAFHLLPRVLLIRTGREEALRRALGKGKQVASITMTLFYLLLWEIALLVFSPAGIGLCSYAVYGLALVRIVLCLLPQNQWQDRYPPLTWAVARNIPFFLLGAIVASLFFLQRGTLPGLSLMWLAIFLSFAFYLPVVLWANQNPKIGMLMLPKTCSYVWILLMCLSL